MPTQYFDCANCGEEIYVKAYSHHYKHVDKKSKCTNPWPIGIEQ